MSIGPPRQANTPPSRTRRAARSHRVARSVQCQAAAAYSRSAGGCSPSSSRREVTTVTGSPAVVRVSTAHICGSGSTAVTLIPAPATRRVALPVPAPISIADETDPSPTSRSSSSAG